MGIAVGGPIAAAIIASLEMKQPGADQNIIDGSCEDITPGAKQNHKGDAETTALVALVGYTVGLIEWPGDFK